MLLPYPNNIIHFLQRFAFVLPFLLLIFAYSCAHQHSDYKKIKQEKNIQKTKTPIQIMKSFDFEALKQFRLTEEEEQFKLGLESVAEYDFDTAEKIFLNLYYSSADENIKRESAKIIFNILFLKSEWNKIRKFDSIAHKGLEDEDRIMILAKAFARVPPERLSYSQDSVTINFTKSPTNCPIIPCLINGKKRYFWFDTGANYSVISSDIAAECDVFPIIREHSKARTGTIRKINIYPAVVDSCSVGNLTVYNSPFVIVHDFDLKLRLFGSHTKTKIDGIIGWKIIQHLDALIDYTNYTMTLRRPQNKQIPAEMKNFFWLGCPFIVVKEIDRNSLIFGLDLGAENSCITHNIFEKKSFDEIYGRIKPQTSVGGEVYFNAKLVSRLTFNLDNTQVEFHNISTSFQVQHLFLNLDGILGCDFTQDSKIHLDIRNGIFRFTPPEEK